MTDPWMILAALLGILAAAQAIGARFSRQLIEAQRELIDTQRGVIAAWEESVLSSPAKEPME